MGETKCHTLCTKYERIQIKELVDLASKLERWILNPKPCTYYMYTVSYLYYDIYWLCIMQTHLHTGRIYADQSPTCNGYFAKGFWATFHEQRNSTGRQEEVKTKSISYLGIWGHTKKWHHQMRETDDMHIGDSKLTGSPGFLQNIVLAVTTLGPRLWADNKTTKTLQQ